MCGNMNEYCFNYRFLKSMFHLFKTSCFILHAIHHKIAEFRWDLSMLTLHKHFLKKKFFSLKKIELLSYQIFWVNIPNLPTNNCWDLLFCLFNSCDLVKIMWLQHFLQKFFFNTWTTHFQRFILFATFVLHQS